MIPFIAIAAVLILAVIVLIVNGSRKSGGVRHQLREHEHEEARLRRAAVDRDEANPS